MKKELIKGATSSGVIKILNILINFILGVVLARVLGPEDFGTYSYIIAIITVLAIPASSGMANFLVKFVSEYHTLDRWDAIKGVLKWSNKVMVIVTTIITLGFYIVTYFFVDNENYRTSLFIAGPIILMYSLGVLRTGALKGLRHIFLSLLPDKIITRGVVILILLFFLFTNKKIGSEEAIIIFFIGSIIGFLFGSIALYSKIKNKIIDVKESRDIKKWRKISVPFIIAGSLQLSNNKIDVFILGFFVQNEQIGFYEVAFKGALFVSFALQALNLFIAPYYSRFSTTNDFRAIKKMTSYSVIACFLTAVLITGIFYFFGEPIILLFYGSDYISAYSILVLLSLAQLINVAFGPIIQYLSMCNGQNHVVVATGLTIVLNILFNILFIPQLGVIGAAVSLILSYLIRNSYLLFVSIKKYGLDTSIVGSIRYYFSH